MESMKTHTIFTPDAPCNQPPKWIPGGRITKPAAMVTADATPEAKSKGDAFAEEIRTRWVADFEKKESDRMAHVSTFIAAAGKLYMSYYANTQEAKEDPGFQTARLAYCPEADPQRMTVLDIQSVGDACYDGTVDMVYDTILMRKDETTIFVLWTASVSGKYYRLYRSFDLVTEKLGDVGVNRFQVGEVVNDFSTSGIQNALWANGIGVKKMYSDIGIMQKLSGRMENGEYWNYTGAYSGDFNCIIKSRDLITWEYVSQPDFPNASKWENAVYVLGDRCFYFVRQQDDEKTGFLTAYHLDSGVWETPVLVEDCQSRSDFIVYQGQLWLIHAPIDREHIGILRVDTESLADSRVLLQADMQGSCFYPYVQYGEDGELMMSYTVARRHIRLAKCTLSRYL